MKIRTLALAALLVLPFASTACSDSTGDLSTEEISDAFQKGGLDKKTADCIADDVKDADLTKDELDEFNKSQDVSSKAGKVLMDAMTSCLDIDIPTTVAGG